MSITYYSIPKIFFRVFDEHRVRVEEGERAIARSLNHSITSLDRAQNDGPTLPGDVEKEALKKSDGKREVVQL